MSGVPAKWRIAGHERLVGLPDTEPQELVGVADPDAVKPKVDASKAEILKLFGCALSQALHMRR
jgi:hypothetical protein